MRLIKLSILKSSYRKLYSNVLKFIFSTLVQSKIIPNESILKNTIDYTRPTIYVLHNASKIDLFIIREQCIKYKLPDPLKMLKINNISLPRYLFVNSSSNFSHYCKPNIESIKLFQKYLTLHYKESKLDIQILLISIIYRRSARYKIRPKVNLYLNVFTMLQKIFLILCGRCDNFVCFSPTISLLKIATAYGEDKKITQKLLRVAQIYFFRQYLVTVGPSLSISTRRYFFNKLTHSKVVRKAIENEARSKKISQNEAQKRTIKIMKEIFADFSYKAISMADRIIKWLWHHLYQDIHIHGSEYVRLLAQNRHKIIYIPCHRSHMDYLLLSYVLYNEGLSPPYIAAGINLNFWPAGLILRHLGAFFIRRTFKGNKLYSTIFREYLVELISIGHSIEYFIEGTRSRTGRLIEPKTGILLMTLYAMLREPSKFITFVPVYIGYEQVIEVSTYIKELQGSKKEKENLLQTIRSLYKLRNLGQGYINFGKPLILHKYLDKYVPNWQTSINLNETQKPIWITPIVNDLAFRLMVRINEASAVNAMNLCVTALLSSYQYSLTRIQLIEQLECYIQLLQNTPYSPESTVPNISAKELVDHAIKMNKFKIEQEVIILPHKQVILMTYYRNNIYHMLAMPSLIALIVQQHYIISKSELLHKITLIYPLMKNEMFLRWEKSDLALLLESICKELIRQDIIIMQNDHLKPTITRYFTLQVLAAGISEMLQRFAIIFAILRVNHTIKRSVLEKDSRILLHRISIRYGIHTLDFDKNLFNRLIVTLRNEGFISKSTHINSQRIQIIWQIIENLINKDVRLLIENTIK